jgi:hypothetical protein
MKKIGIYATSLKGEALPEIKRQLDASYLCLEDHIIEDRWSLFDSPVEYIDENQFADRTKIPRQLLSLIRDVQLGHINTVIYYERSALGSTPIQKAIHEILNESGAFTFDAASECFDVFIDKRDMN